MTKRIVIVGGGAGGLELATKLGRKLGRKGKAQITLVDRKRTHIWKPLLHEVATGTLDAGVDAISYRVHANNHGFEFQLGSLQAIDRDAKQISLEALNDEDGTTLLPARTLDYDLLVLAIGSVSNDFNTQGVSEHCIFLDSPEQAHRFHKRMLNAFLKMSVEAKADDHLDIAIVGAGATGVELSAELHKAAEELARYGVKDVGRDRLRVTLVEAGPRILPALPERISASAHHELQELGVRVMTGTMVTSADEEGLNTKHGEKVSARLKVWAAGIKAPEFLKEFDGLEVNRINQLVVLPSLQTSRDPNIFALGDCASCPLGEDGFVPPRAQAAHQMASHLYKNLLARMEGRELTDYQYKDHGSLVSLSQYSTVGSLMGNLMRGSMMVEGRLARIVYISLYRMHQAALHGWFKTGMITMVDRINRVIRPRLKLH